MLEADGSVLAHAINAASAALAHSGVEMRDLVTSVTVAMSANGPIVDLTAEDEKSEIVCFFVERFVLSSVSFFKAQVVE